LVTGGVLTLHLVSSTIILFCSPRPSGHKGAATAVRVFSPSEPARIESLAFSKCKQIITPLTIRVSLEPWVPTRDSCYVNVDALTPGVDRVKPSLFVVDHLNDPATIQELRPLRGCDPDIRDVLM
jgi:hypothetical protein